MLASGRLYGLNSQGIKHEKDTIYLMNIQHCILRKSSRMDVLKESIDCDQGVREIVSRQANLGSFLSALFLAWEEKHISLRFTTSVGNLRYRVPKGQKLRLGSTTRRGMKARRLSSLQYRVNNDVPRTGRLKADDNARSRLLWRWITPRN